jgi:hypothetical protein
MNWAAVAMAAPVMALLTTCCLSLLLTADTSAPVTAPPIIAFFCKIPSQMMNLAVQA